MAPSTKSVKTKKVKSAGGAGAKKKLTVFNKFMKAEMARLKDEQPDIPHRERFKLATERWKTADENPKKGQP